jgi:hypothetical protein
MNSHQRCLTPKPLSIALSLVIALAGTTFRITAKPRNLELQNPGRVAKDITFKTKNPSDLAVGARQTIEAVVFDEGGNKLRGAQVEWRLADPDHKAFVFLGTPVNDLNTNSIEVVGLDNQTQLKAPSQVSLIAKYGHVWNVFTLNYIATTRVETSLTATPNVITVRPGEAASFTVKVTDQKTKTELPKISIKTDPLAPDASSFLSVTSSDDDKTVTVTGKYGDPKKPVPEIMSLIVRAGGASNVVAIRYLYESVKVLWDVLPPNIVGDNYGRTIKHDFYCIEVTIQNYSGDDMALAAMAFDLGDEANLRPNTSYSTVHGSLARRKLTHPRTLTLAAISAAGQLLTGFNPFFHNTAHGRNFSQFIDIISNPLEKGTALVWQDSYPDEVARFEQDVLKDDKVITSGSTFKTKIFIPKRDVFPNPTPGQKDDLDQVRDELGKLVIFGYKFHRGPLQTLTNSPATPPQP